MFIVSSSDFVVSFTVTVISKNVSLASPWIKRYDALPKSVKGQSIVKQGSVERNSHHR